MPVSNMNTIVVRLNEFYSTIQHQLQKFAFPIKEWINIISVIDKLPLGIRMKPATKSKILSILTELKKPSYSLQEWRAAYKLWHAIGDWWTNGHTKTLYEYNLERVQQLQAHFDQQKQSKSAQFNVLLTMTSCKRLDLLTRTIDSMIHNCTDIEQHVGAWLVIDDNSSEQDRKKMQEMYPFITFIMKTPAQKGHPQSMNIIRDYLLEHKQQYQYLFHIEDDWDWWYPDNYITKTKLVADSNEQYGQCLVNFEYTEDEYTAQDIWNREMYYLPSSSTSTTAEEQRYFVHEYFVGERLGIEQNLLGAPCSMYWPHFSFRVGITKTKIFEDIGTFNIDAKHFEMEYAYRYVAAHYKSAMLDCCYTTHTGRRTYERDTTKLNAYDLNEEQQFGNQPKTKQQIASNVDNKSLDSSLSLQELALQQAKNTKEYNPNAESVKGIQIDANALKQIRSYVINLKRRPERLLSFIKKNNQEMPPFEVFEGIDGKLLQPSTKLQKIFETGDYKFRRGIVGCAYSHMHIWADFLKSNSHYCVVLEDDVKLGIQFKEKVMHLIHSYNFDVMFLHWNPYAHVQNKDEWMCNFTQLEAEVWTVEQSMQRNMGSGAGYILTRKGALQLLQSINEKGMPNAVDWVIMKQPELRIMYSKPMLVFADCWQSNTTIQSDIQTEYNSVCFKDVAEWLEHDIDLWKTKCPVIKSNEYPKEWKRAKNNIYVLPIATEIPVSFLCKWYTIGDQYKIVVPDHVLNSELYKQFTWFNDRVNMVCV